MSVMMNPYIHTVSSMFPFASFSFSTNPLDALKVVGLALWRYGWCNWKIVESGVKHKIFNQFKLNWLEVDQCLSWSYYALDANVRIPIFICQVSNMRRTFGGLATKKSSWFWTNIVKFWPREFKEFFSTCIDGFVDPRGYRGTV